MASPSLSPAIAIIGAGPVGLTFGAFLQLASIPFTIFESDTSPSTRTQGGTLDLHATGGLLALEAAGLWDTFVRYARYEGED